MRQRRVEWVSVLMLLTGISILPYEAPVHSADGQARLKDTALSVALDPMSAANGHAILLEVDGRQRGILAGSFIVHLNHRRIPLWAHPTKPEGYFFAIIGISYHAEKGTSTLLLEWSDRFGDHYQTVPYRVVAGDYRSERLTVSAKKVSPSAGDLRRIRSEKKTLKRIYAADPPQPTWRQPFQVPVKSAMTSPYGTRRLFNGSIKSYHNGVDFRAARGTPVTAANDGIVRLASNLFYSGNLILIDHGMHVFTQYAHLSKIDVHPGQWVEKGQVIGFSGATGRITGPHLHWGVKINGVNVDPMQLIEISETMFAAPAEGQTIADRRSEDHPPSR